MPETISIGKNVTFSGKTENLETGQPVDFDGEVTLVSVELRHDRRHLQTMETLYDVTMHFDGHEQDVAFSVESLDNDAAVLGACAADVAHDIGLMIAPEHVGRAIVNALGDGI